MNSVNLIVRESITQALIRLMHKKDFADIKIKELTDLAGVGRVSFYRNYESKEDVILTYLLETSQEWWQDHQVQGQEKWQAIFELMAEFQEEFQAIYQSGATNIIYQYLRQFLASEGKSSYHQAMLVGSCYGLVDEWLSQGMSIEGQELEKKFQATLMKL